MKITSGILFTLLCSLSLATEKDNKNILILGDSISYANFWVNDFTAALQSSVDNQSVIVFNASLPSETVSGLSEVGHAGGRFARPCVHERLTRLITATQPSIILSYYGMNDGLMASFSSSNFEAWQRGNKLLKQQADAAGARLIFITPPLYAPLDANVPYNQLLEEYGKWLMEQKEQGWEVVDPRPLLQEKILATKSANPQFIYAGDKVHPTRESHALISEAIIATISPVLSINNSIPERSEADFQAAQQELCTRRDALLTQTGHQRPEIAGYQAAAPSIELPSDEVHSWHGYRQLRFKCHGRDALLVLPHENKALGKPWLWRTEFFGVEPQAGLELLKQGFVLAYINMENLYGGPEAMQIMDAFHQHLTEERGLSLTPVLEGYSRGGLFAFNWAELRPHLIAGIYADNPVCNVRSWPQAKSKADWERLLTVYGLGEEMIQSPIDNVQNMAAARVPVLLVVKEHDELVPVKENADIWMDRYQAAGGPVKVIRRAGGHHPHSLKEPAQIVDFVLQATHQKLPTRIACIGDSITFGAGVQEHERWSTLLQNELGNSYQIHNYGISARTLMNKGDRPFMREQNFQKAIDCHADIIFIALGTNDSKAHNWKHKANFERDYRSMIEQVRAENPTARIICFQCVPALSRTPNICGEIIFNEVNPSIIKIAKEMNCETIDLHSALKGHDDKLPDGVHPNAAGHAIMAEAIKAYLQAQ